LGLLVEAALIRTCNFVNMNLAASPQTNSGLLGDAIQTTKLLHRSDKRCRYAMEIGGIGFILMMGMSLFGGSAGSGGGSPSAPAASYNPPPTASAPAAPGNPTVSQAQLNAIKQQAGGGNVISTVPVAPIKVAPAMKESDVQVDGPKADASDPFTYTGKKKGPRPAYQESNGP